MTHSFPVYNNDLLCKFKNIYLLFRKYQMLCTVFISFWKMLNFNPVKTWFKSCYFCKTWKLQVKIYIFPRFEVMFAKECLVYVAFLPIPQTNYKLTHGLGTNLWHLPWTTIKSLVDQIDICGIFTYKLSGGIKHPQTHRPSAAHVWQTSL